MPRRFQLRSRQVLRLRPSPFDAASVDLVPRQADQHRLRPQALRQALELERAWRRAGRLSPRPDHDAAHADRLSTAAGPSSSRLEPADGAATGLLERAADAERVSAGSHGRLAALLGRQSAAGLRRLG